MQIIFYDIIPGFSLNDLRTMFLEPLRFLLGFPHVIPNTTLLMLAALHPLASEKILLGIQQLVIAAGKAAGLIAAGKAAGFLRTAIFYLTTSRTSEIPIPYSMHCILQNDSNLASLKLI